MRRLALIAICLTFVVALACNKSETNHSATNSAPAASPARPTAATPATSPVASAEKIGVAECDQFLEAYDACVSSKVPEAARAQYRSTLSQWRQSWRSLAANPQTKGSLAQACKSAIESSRTSMKSFGCTF